MKKGRFIFLSILFFGGVIFSAPCDSLLLYKGQAITAVQWALDNYSDSTALDSVYRYGVDSRLYVMIRGWLVQELQGVQSILGSTPPTSKHYKKLQERESFLERSIQRIDLE